MKREVTRSNGTVALEPVDDHEFTYTLTDTPGFPSGVTVRKLEYQREGSPSKELKSHAPWQLTPRDGAKIQAGSAVSYTLKVFWQKPDDVHVQDAECVNGQSGYGLFNTVTLNSSGRKINDSACTPLPITRNITFVIAKESLGAETQPLPDATFELWSVDSTHDAPGEKLETFTETNTGMHRLEYNPGEYYVVEAQAPDGYSLLAQPVKVRLAWQGKQAHLTVPNRADEIIARVAPTEETPAGQVLLRIADVSTGELPRTGSVGIWGYCVLGIIVVGAGAWLLYRRTDTAEE